ncbi:MAG TPA: ABC transporter permease [Acidimicrobiales bacterium]
MRQLIRAELLKLRSTRGAFWILIGLPVAVVLPILISIDSAGRESGNFPLETVEGVRNVLSAASAGGMLVLILGIMAMTGEYRHRTVSETFLLTPARGKVVAAKLATYAIVGFAVAMAAGALTLAIALPWLAQQDAHVRLLEDVGMVMAGATAATVLYGTLGVAVGALVRNQAAALVVALLWTMLFEGLLVGLVPALGRWLPGGAASALSLATIRAGDLLPMWAAALVLAAYAAGLAMLANRLVVRRDVA